MPRHAFLKLFAELTGLIKPEDAVAVNQLFVNMSDEDLAMIALKKITPIDLLKPRETESANNQRKDTASKSGEA